MQLTMKRTSCGCRKILVNYNPPMANAGGRDACWVGRENVMAGADCGFAQSPFGQRVRPSIMWAKLKSLAEGAKITSQALWGHRSAA